MDQINSYKDLEVWKKAMDLVVEIYDLTDKFPKSETYGLVNQMRRAAVAIPSNIAEGQKRAYSKEFLQFLYISYGSGAELETQIEICKRLHKFKDLDYTNTERLLKEVMMMLNGLISALKRKL
jgi:four helix bundle protein